MGDGLPPTRATNITLAAIAVASSVGLVEWLNKPLFRDEGASLYSAHLDWAALWPQSRVVDLVLLPYEVFLHVWIDVSGSIVWVRLPSVLAFGATVFLVGRLGTRIGGGVCGVLAALVAATNPLMLDAAVDARPYALSALTCTAAAVALIRWLDGGTIRWVWGFCLASLATLLLQLFAVLAPLAILGAAIVVRAPTFHAQVRKLIVPIGVLIAGVAAGAVLVAPQRGQISWIHFPEAFKPIVSSLLGPAYGNEVRYAELIFLLVIAGIGMCAVAWRRTGFRAERREIDFLAISLAWAFIPTLVLVVVSFVKPAYLDRYVTESVPGFALAIALLLARGYHLAATSWTTTSRRAVGGLCNCAVGVLVVIPTCSIPAAEHVSENLQAAAQYLVDHVGDDGAAALPDHAVTAAIGYYTRADHERLRIWPELALQPYVDGLDLRYDLGALSKAPNNVWLLVDSSHPRTSAFMNSLIDHAFAVVGTAQLPGLRIFHYRRNRL